VDRLTLLPDSRRLRPVPGFYYLLTSEQPDGVSQFWYRISSGCCLPARHRRILHTAPGRRCQPCASLHLLLVPSPPRCAMYRGCLSPTRWR